LKNGLKLPSEYRGFEFSHVKKLIFILINQNKTQLACNYVQRKKSITTQK